MALRQIRKKGEDVLAKRCKDVTEITPSILTLLDDMAETMYGADGVGLAAPQVGILKRIIVIDIGEGIIELINPEILEESGEQVGTEGCLSVPGILGEVKRPNYIKVKALDRTGKDIIVEDSELMARALCHEIDHLNGVLFTERVIRYLHDE
jgi:peptide deformylase